MDSKPLIAMIVAAVFVAALFKLGTDISESFTRVVQNRTAVYQSF